jgi:hypothetical protein
MILDEDDLAGTLGSLLQAWRANGAPEIADAIDRVSAVLVEKEKPITKDGAKSAKAAWYAAVEANRPTAMPRILEAVLPANDRASGRSADVASPRMGSRRASAFIRSSRCCRSSGTPATCACCRRSKRSRRTESSQPGGAVARWRTMGSCRFTPSSRSGRAGRSTRK